MPRAHYPSAGSNLANGPFNLSIIFRLMLRALILCKGKLINKTTNIALTLTDKNSYFYINFNKAVRLYEFCILLEFEFLHTKFRPPIIRSQNYLIRRHTNLGTKFTLDVEFESGEFESAEGFQANFHVHKQLSI